MQTSNPTYLFQTEDAVRNEERKLEKSKNKHGNPKDLKSKVLNIELDRTTPKRYQLPRVFTCEASHVCRLYDMNDGKTCKVYKGHGGPVTCCQVESLMGDDQDRFLYTGSWDSTIKRWNVRTGECVETLLGHADYVKSLLLFEEEGLLISGSVDATLAIWDIRSQPNRLLYKLSGHSRGIEKITRQPGSNIFWTCGSESSIRRWEIRREGGQSLDDEGFWGHQSNVYSLMFEPEDPESLWTASADKTVRQWSVYEGLHEETRFEHPDFCTDVLVLSDGNVCTACRDENVRLCNVNLGNLAHVYSGHYESVTKLLQWKSCLVTASLDGTLRSWNLDLSSVSNETNMASEDTFQKPEANQPQLTEEELAELEELMSD
ncbi:WD repeat protein [Schizosaccharomyces osmophilus]|uniref:WD repeat protein n=1 Tax=Schizosaccharomyces osmophilus TaxID=2545709 RepID=A0AAE9WGC6_9SCHI|nr:WD repeat protein [Schizosaccharomyces osmophilus]WBW75253.1 WD repeat protein [Schizosaccharomyces osmophilus]